MINRQEYLDTLLAYNNEDVINLEYLLHHAYNNLIKRVKMPFDEIFLPKKKIQRPYEADKSVIRELRSFTRHYY